jgi:hypothetical protein
LDAKIAPQGVVIAREFAPPLLHGGDKLVFSGGALFTNAAFFGLQTLVTH